LVCDRALHHGHLARATEIEADTVRTAIADLGLAEVPVAPSAATAWTADDRSLTLFAESRGGARNGESSFPGAQRQSPVRRFAQVLGVLLIAAAVVFGISYWQHQEDALKAPIVSPVLPAPPARPEARSAKPPPAA